MTCLQVFLAVIFPPLAVLDRGCGNIVIVFLLTLVGWIPGVIAALVICNSPQVVVVDKDGNAVTRRP